MSARIFDGNLELRDIADGAETATANETAISFDCRKIQEYKAVIYVTAVAVDGADEVYVFDISVSDLVGGTFTKIAQLPDIAATGAGVYEVPLNGAIAEKLDADSDWIRVGCTHTGATTSITYGAYLAKI